MDLGTNCAYNQTKGYFLGMDVADADFSAANSDMRVPTFAPNSGSGLWMRPFRGISPVGVRSPLDLVYLNEDCSVIDVVESFPTSRVSPLSSEAASVLALPTRSIYSSHTQPGDQVLVCTAEELDWHLKKLSKIHGFARAVQSPTPMNEESFFGGGGELEEEIEDLFEKPRVAEQAPEPPRPEGEQEQAPAIVKPWTKGMRQPARGWLSKLLAPEPEDPRSPRAQAPTISAYFWTGGVAQPHPIRDISSSGLYVVTKDRWYLGTLIRMTLTITDPARQGSEKSISVHAKAVRYGEDGVGLQFVLATSRDRKKERDPMVDWLDKVDMDRFLRQVYGG